MRKNPFDVLVRLRKIDEKMARAELANKRRAHDLARRKLEELKAIHREDIDVGDTRIRFVDRDCVRPIVLDLKPSGT